LSNVEVLVDPEERPTFDAFARARMVELLRFGHALTGNPDSAADLVQDALVRTGLRWSRLRVADPEAELVRVLRSQPPVSGDLALLDRVHARIGRQRRTSRAATAISPGSTRGRIRSPCESTSQG